MITRHTLDCRRYPTSTGCSLTISGTRDEVLKAGLAHAIKVHGEHDTPQMRMELENALEPEHPIVPHPGRKVADCRRIPSDFHCSLTISGREDEVLDAAVEHAIADHQHARNQELIHDIRAGLVDEVTYSPTEEAGAPA